MENLSGKQLGRYQVISPLGEGGMAAVYKAFQPGMERYVALKILPQAYARDPEFTGRFEQEAKVIAKLQHPHILPVHDFGEAESYTYIVMPLVETGTLADLLRGKPPLPLQRIRRIAVQMGDALDYAHSQGLIHRDVKPSNILIDKRGNCLLTDFGIAKMVEGTKHFTQTGGIVGTPHYMSPEQGSGARLTPASDIYSLGVVIYEMATGRVPFDAETPMAVVIKHMHDPLPPPSLVNDTIGPALEGVILKAMAKDPKDRYATAADLVEAVRYAIPERASSTGEGVITTVPAPELAARESAARESRPLGGLATGEGTFAEPEPTAARRTRWPWLVAGGLVLLGICGLGTFGVIRLVGANSNTSATESADATEAALAVQQQTVESADQIRTATALAQAATPVPSSTAPLPTAATVESQATGLPAGSEASNLLAAHWPVALSESFDENQNGWNPFQNFTDEYGTRSFTIQRGKYHWQIDPERDLNVHDNPDLLPFTDFFVAVDMQQLAGPDTADYGVVFRRVDTDSFYSFSISETGQYSVQVIDDGEWTTLIDWTDSPAIQAGGVNRLAASGEGEAFHFFINDQHVDSLVDDRLERGIVGVVVDLFDAGIPAEWEFDNFELRRPWDSTVVESFEAATGLWEAGSNSYSDLTETFAIEDGLYRWTIDCQNSDFGCISSTDLNTVKNATDFEVSVDLRMADGPADTQYGVRFRYDGSNYFEYAISDAGTFTVLLWNEQELTYYYNNSPAAAIRPGAVNRMTVTAQGSNFTFYINGVVVGEISEPLLPTGAFGLSASLSGAGQAAFEFDNFKVRQP